jgi:hypothetical protein
MIECGRRAITDRETLTRIARKLAIPPHALGVAEPDDGDFTSMMDEPVGQAWGWPLDRARGAGWWQGLIKEPKPGFTAEDGKRTFALSEIMVGQPYTGQHIAHALHDEILRGRHEARATLLVNPTNENAYHMPY